MRAGRSEPQHRQQADTGEDGNGPLLHDGNLVLLFAVTLLTGTALSAITPAFPAIPAALGTSPSATGLLITMYALPAIVLAPLLGITADRMGRKRVLVASMLLYGLAGGACALTPDFTVLLVLRFVQGIGGSVLYSLSTAIISDHYTGARRTRSLAYDSVALGLGAASFPVIGGLLAAVSWRLPFALAFLTVPAALLLLRRFSLPALSLQPDMRNYLRDLGRQLRLTPVRGNLLVSVLLGIVLIGAFFGYLPQTLEARFGASALLIGVIFSVRALSLSGVSLLFDRLLKLGSPVVLTRYAAALIVLALALIPLLPSIWWIMLPSALFGIGYGVMLTGLELLLTDGTPEPEHAALLSLQSSAAAVGNTGGPVLMGLLFGAFGGSIVFFAAAGIGALVLLLTLRTLS